MRYWLYMEYAEFQNLVRTKGRELYRDMPWRQDTRAYYILVSELMLQQTQVLRVIPKFEAFIDRFPDFRSLAAAPLSDVLRLWTGLGYNRRAKYLHVAAQKIASEYNGQMPRRYEEIIKLPGVGPSTAGAIMAYAFNQPVLFIETNVRTVYFHYFFEPEDRVSDAQLIPLIEATIDRENPREFYWALMDYGTFLKQIKGKSINAQSLHYKKQSKFKGSIREMRGAIVRLLGEADLTVSELRQALGTDERFKAALEGLVKDGLVVETNQVLHLAQ